jgi:hypothetical protein
LYANSDASLVIVQAQLGTWGSETFRYYALENGHLFGSWGSDNAPLGIDLSDRTSRVATIYGNGNQLVEVRSADGSIVFSKIWRSQPLSVSFAEDGASLFLSDEAGMLSRLDERGETIWHVQLGCSAVLARDATRLYAAGWDGRVRAFTMDGHQRWQLDLTAAMSSETVHAKSAKSEVLHVPERAAMTSQVAPSGVNLLRSGQAVLTVGGTRGWKSAGKVTVEPSALTNGNWDDVTSPWLPADELYWDATTSRRPWAEIALKTPTNLHALTVHENRQFPESWPNESLIQVWDDARQRWRTVKHAAFLRGPDVNYTFDLKQVTKLRYVPWGNLFHNLHTSEIELR